MEAFAICQAFMMTNILPGIYTNVLVFYSRFNKSYSLINVKIPLVGQLAAGTEKRHL